MLVDSREFPEQTEAADVIVVGAGAVGIVTALKLARAGLRTLLLEAGGTAVEEQSQRYFENAVSVGARHQGLHLGRFRLLGGTTNFWGGQLVAFGPHLFEPRPWANDPNGWPISAADLEPFYDEALALAGMGKVVTDDAALLRRLRQPMPALPEELRYFFTRWVPQPNFASHFARELRENARLECVLNAPVTGLVADADGRVTQVEIRTPDGQVRTLAGKRFVLANGTIEIARLLMMPLADGRTAPWSGNPWLGRGFMDHIDLGAGEVRPIDARKFHDLFENALVDGLKYQPKIKLTAETQVARGLTDISAHFLFNSSYAEHFANAKIFVRSFLRGRPDRDWRSYPARIGSLVRVGVPMIARYLRYRRIHSPADRGIQLRLTGEQAMVRESGIRLRAERDGLGMPMIELDWRIAGSEIETFGFFAEALARALEEAGLATVTLDPRFVARDPTIIAEVDDANHHMGMCRMAASATDGVVDRDCVVFGSPNLSVAGAATYRSTGFPNPTFTAMALGLRIADRLIRERAA